MYNNPLSGTCQSATHNLNAVHGTNVIKDTLTVMVDKRGGEKRAN